jgi:hypothetical protein
MTITSSVRVLHCLHRGDPADVLTGSDHAHLWHPVSGARHSVIA